MVRAKIQATKLVQLLQDDAFGRIDPIADGRRDSAKFLLNKSISNAPTIVGGTGEGGAIKIAVTVAYQ